MLNRTFSKMFQLGSLLTDYLTLGGHMTEEEDRDDQSEDDNAGHGD